MSSPQKINFSYNSPNNANSVAQQYYVQNREFQFPSKVHENRFTNAKTSEYIPQLYAQNNSRVGN